MQTEASLERDTDLVQEYIDVLNRRAERPSLFGKLASLTKLGTLRRRLSAAVARHPDPELERAEAAAIAESETTWFRRIVSNFWGGRLLLGLTLVLIQQAVLICLLILSVAYANLTAAPPSPESGYLPAATRNAIIFLVVFVFAFFFTTPLVSFMQLWGGRFLRAWRLTMPATALLLLAASAATFLVFRASDGLENPAFAKDSIHQFVEGRNRSSDPAVSPYKSYQSWLDMNWLLKDPRFRADYERYLRNGPGRWLTNRFDTTDSSEWAKKESLEYVGEFVDSNHDQARFAEWLKDYVERNKIFSRNIDTEIDQLIGPAQQRFLTIWQAEPFLRDRDLHVRRHYFGQIFERVQFWGTIFFASLILLYLLLYLIGPTLIATRWLLRSVRLERASDVVGRLNERYYTFPERRELLGVPFFESSFETFRRVHRSYVRAVLAVSVVVFGIWVLWLTSLSAPSAAATTQSQLMSEFVLFPSPDGPPAPVAAAPQLDANLAVASATGPNAIAPAFETGMGDPAFGVDSDGDGVPDEGPLPPVEARLAALKAQVEDSDYETRKRFKATEELLEAYQREIESLKSRNRELEQRQSGLLGTISSLESRIGSAEASSREAAGRAQTVDSKIEGLAVQVDRLESTTEDRITSLSRRAEGLEKRDDQIQATVDTVAMDLDDRTREMRARTERLGERTTTLAERTEQLADLERTAFEALIREFQDEVETLERRSHSRLYRMFNKKEARARLADLRRRIQSVRGMLQRTSAPEATKLFDELTKVLDSIGPVETRFR